MKGNENICSVKLLLGSGVTVNVSFCQNRIIKLSIQGRENQRSAVDGL